MEFSTPEKKRKKLSMALAGFSNSGKTWTALCIAKSLGGKWAMLDTEGEGAEWYRDVLDMDSWCDRHYVALSEAANYKLYIDAIQSAVVQGYDGIIIDSLSPFWLGVRRHVTHRAQEIAQERQGNADEFAAWDGVGGGNDVFYTMLDLLTSPDTINTIACIQMKEGTKRTTTTDARGRSRTTILKTGPTPVFRPGEHRYQFRMYAVIERGKAGRQLYIDKMTGGSLEGEGLMDTFPRTAEGWSVGPDGEKFLREVKKWLNYETSE